MSPLAQAPDGTLVDGITELEGAFNGPDGAAARADALTRLQERKTHLEQLQRQHLPVETFAASEALAKALQAAIVVILKPRKEA